MMIGLLQKKEVIQKMGTTRSGRYMNTHGSARRASEYAIVHSNEGTYKWSNPRY